MTLFVVSCPDVVSWRSEWIPRDVKPARAGEQLVSVLPFFEEIHEEFEPCRILRTDISRLTFQVLRIAYATNRFIYRFTSESGIDDYRADDESRGL